MILWRRKRDTGFEIEVHEGRRDLVVTGAWSTTAADAVRTGLVDRVVLNYARGFHEPDLEFLTGLPVRGLFLLSYTLTGLEPIYSLADTLTELSTGRFRGPIDLRRLPRLQSLSTNWSSVERTIEFAPEIHRLYLGGYRPHDLRPLRHLAGLQTLRMKDYPSLTTLDGVQAFSQLQNLLVALARRLIDITAIEALAHTLRDLNLETCRKIPDLRPIAECRALTTLNAANCGELPTAAPLADLPLIEKLYLYESTNILDGDLMPIASLPALRELRMMNRRHYTPTVAAIQEAISRT